MDAGEDALRADSLDAVDQQIIDALVRAREHMGWRHRVQMAEALGVDPSTYNRWEEGTRRVPARALVRVSQVSGLSISRLLEEPEGDERPRAEYMARITRNEREIAELKARLAAAAERDQRHAQKYDELSDKVDSLIDGITELRRRRGNSEAAGS